MASTTSQVKEICREVAGWERPTAGDSGKKLRGYQKYLESVLGGGVRLQQFRLHGHLVAVFFVHCCQDPVVRGQRSVFFRYNSRFRPAALRWIRKKIRENRHEYNSFTETGVLLRDAKELLPTFRRSGFALHSTVLAGDAKIALKELIRKKNPPLTLEHLDLRLLVSRDIGKVMRLQKRVFTRIPDRGYYSHIPSRMRSDRRKYLGVIRSPRKGKMYGIWRGDRLMGFFGVFVYKACAGTSLTFDFPIQGKGVAKTAYRIMLEEMRRRRVKTFHGGTSQPAVLGLAKVMKRKPVSYLLRHKDR